MSVLSSRRGKISKDPPELNLMPIMNLFVILIPFLLLTAAFVKNATIQLYLPNMSSEPVPQENPENNSQKINLTLAVGEEGLQIGGADSILPVIKKIEDKKTGKMVHDFKTLRETLIKIKKAYPETENIILMPQDETKYDLVVRLMDATRGTVITDEMTGKSREFPLFPVVSIGEVQR